MKKLLCLALCVLMAAGCVLPAGLAEGKPVLKVLTGFLSYDANTDPSAALVEEITGYKVQYDQLPAEDMLTKLNAILAAKDPYDVIVMGYATFENTVGLGAYRELNDLMDQYGLQLKAGTTADLWNNTTVDGKVLGIPYRLSIENYNSGLRVRTDLLKQAGIEQVPTTLTELTAALQAIKDKLGIIPFTGTGAIVDEIAGAFGIPTSWVLQDGKLAHRATTAGAKAYVTYMHDLFVQGLLDSEWAQNSGTAAQEKFLSGKAAMQRVYWWEEPAASTTLKTNFPDVTYDYLPPQKGENGVAQMAINRASDMVVVIPKAAPHPEDAMKWMNAKVKDVETFRYLCIGKEGVHYQMVNGEYTPIQPAFSEQKNRTSDFLTGTIGSEYGTYWAQTRVRKNDIMYAEFQNMQKNVASATICYEPVSFMTPNKEYTALIAPVNTFVSDTFLQMIVGSRSIDEWDQFLAELEAMGGGELNEIVNAWWEQNSATLIDKLTRK
jgi:putative aldouronate transport system substrate-binding protein